MKKDDLHQKGVWTGDTLLKKIWRMMKLTGLFMLISFVAISAGTYSQNTRFSFKIENGTLNDLFLYLEQNSEFRFSYNKSDLDDTQRISIKFENESVEQILDKVLDTDRLSISVKNEYVIITNKGNVTGKPFDNAINQPVRTVSGKVTDSSGTPLPGVTVVISGTTQGTITDSDGQYSLKNVPGDATLVFSFVGMKTLEIPVEGKSKIDISLVEEAIGIEEVVAVGFGTQKKVNLTGSVATVDTKMLESRPVSNVVQSLQGIVPGLNIYQNNGGEIGTKPTINIRGVTTIGQGSNGSPLILINGMEGDLTTLNPADIQSISVLKDAAASSIYGSRAPFGVILINTKGGKPGRIQVNYNNSLRWSSPLRVPKMADSYSFALYMNDQLMNAGKAVWFDSERLQRILDYQAGRLGDATIIPDPNNPTQWGSGYEYGNDNVDWYKALYKDGSFSQEHSLSVSGGEEKSSYYLSLNYMDQNGLLKFGKDGQKRYTGSVKVASKLSPWAKLEYSGRFIRFETTRPETYRGQHDFWFAEQAWPTLPLYDPNGYLYSSPSAALFMEEGGENDFTSDKFTHQLNLTLEPARGVKVVGNLNYAITDNFRQVVVRKLYNHDVEGNPVLYNSNNSVTEYADKDNYFNADIRAEYQRSIGQHNFQIMVGLQAEKTKYRDISAKRVGIFPESPTINTSTGVSEDGGIVAPEVSGQYYNWSTAGYFGRLNYDYKGKYLLEANLRYDGTSRFRSDKRWNLFPSVSVGWNIAQEPFWQNFSGAVDLLKLRASWGKLGNQNTNSYYPTYSVMGLGTASGTWLTNGSRPNTAFPPSLVSSTLTWEEIKTYNLGLDVGAFNNRLTSSLDAYVRYTNDMVGPAIELPVILGTDVPRTNNTDLKTYGFEFEIAWRDKLTNGLGYNIRLGLSDSRTKIMKYPNDTGALGYNSGGSGEVQYSTFRDHETYGQIWGYTTIGIAKTQEEMDAHLVSLPNGGQNAIGTNWAAGDIMYADTNNDGKIDNGSNTIDDHGDLKVIGNITPRYLFGITLGADYKGFDLSLFFQGVMKRDYFQGSYMFWGNGKSMWESTAFKEHLDYFRDDPSSPLGLNLDSFYPRPIDGDWSGMGKNHETQTKYLQNAAYIRLKSLQIGYSLPSSFFNKTKLRNFRIYISGENIWTGTKLTKIFDPELIDNPGSGGNQYPLSKIWSLGFNLTL